MGTMKDYTEYILFALLFVVASATFLWLILALFGTIMGGQK
jgi:hypothetical protein